MKRFLLILSCCFFCGALPKANAFVMIGQMDAAQITGGGIDFNYTDDLGGPKDLKTFYRWNIPLLTYAFDASFMQYFGMEGRDAVKEAFAAINDFFENEEYSGLSSLDLNDHNFKNNFSSAWLNTTAKNSSIIDIKSLTLGLIVNHLGLGNPYRYSFGIHSLTRNAANTQINFNVRLRNFDPITYKPTSSINGVNYSYRLIHDAQPAVGTSPANAPSFADMEEFTTDTTGNKWTALSAITDAFYGNTAILWTEPPTVFGFGVYYDGENAIGGANNPRHALTYDDAGGLKYLYRTNNYVYEGLDPNVVLMIPANFLPTFAIPVFPGGVSRIYPDPSGISGAYIPRRNQGLIPGLPITSVVPVQAPPALIDIAMRGGIDKIQFQEQLFDSFLGINFTATTHEWTDIFVSTNGQTINNLTSPSRGAVIGTPTLKHFSQQVGRAIFQPDILFVADELGVSPDGVPIAFNRTDNQAWIDNFANNLGPAQLLTTDVGPGVITGPIQYTFTKLGLGFEVIWSGEATVLGNTDSYSLWGHIKGPGPGDIVTFPNDAQMSILENAVSPATARPAITKIYVLGEEELASPDLKRTEESLVIEGSNLASVEGIEIYDGEDFKQEITGSVVKTFINSHNQIVIPPGHIGLEAEGINRTIKLWNTVGNSDNSAQVKIGTGKPIVTGTKKDGLTYDRVNEELTIFGRGFRSKTISNEDGNETLNFLSIVKSDGQTVNYTGSDLFDWTKSSDTVAILKSNKIDEMADGENRLVRVGRVKDPIQDDLVSPTNNVNQIANITTIPKVESIKQNEVEIDSHIRRDQPVEILGKALNTTYRIEIQSEGQSLDPPIYIDLPSLGVSVADNGTRIYITSNTFQSSAADSFNSTNKNFRVYNLAGTDDSKKFNVLKQPSVSTLGGLTTPGIFNRDKLTGDDIIITGTGLKAVKEIEIVTDDNKKIDEKSSISIETALNKGAAIVADSFIQIDTQSISFLSGDSNESTQWRRFSLISPAPLGDVLTPHNLRFLVGTPPKISSLNLNSPIPGNHYMRDENPLLVNGEGLSILSSAEIVDSQGLTIATGSAVLNPSTTAHNPTTFTLPKNLFFKANLLDHPQFSRRLKISTPFGATLSETFSVSATPILPNQINSQFAGGGYDGSKNTLNIKNGGLFINGANFLGLKTVRLEDANSTVFDTINFNPHLPPPGLAVSADGTILSLSKIFLTQNTERVQWADSNGNASRRVRLISGADQNSTSGLIITSN